MSEPVTHAEIEDVLSSIRRLVSEDGRETPVASKPTPKDKPAPRLVLTPSLRVADEPLQNAETFSAQIDTAVADTEQLDTAKVEQAEMQPSAAVESDQPEAEREAQLSAVPESDQPEIDQPDDKHFDAPIGESPSIKPEQHGDDTIVLAVEQLEEDPQPDLVQSADTAPDDAPWQNPGATLFAAAGAAEAVSEVAAESETSAENKPTASFAEKIAALEAAIGQADEQWEPDGEAGEDNAGTAVETLAWEDLEEELVEVAPFSTVDSGEFEDSNPPVDIAPEFKPDLDETAFEQPQEDPLDAAHLAGQAVTDEILGGGVAADETVMDEESLRELVADIVREELQGALGERITRNVRKLVRREIHRALAVQDLG